MTNPASKAGRFIAYQSVIPDLSFEFEKRKIEQKKSPILHGTSTCLYFKNILQQPHTSLKKEVKIKTVPEISFCHCFANIALMY